MASASRLWVLVVSLGIFGAFPLSGDLFFGIRTRESVSRNIEIQEFFNKSKTSYHNQARDLLFLNPAWLLGSCICLPFLSDQLGRKRTLFISVLASILAHAFQLVAASQHALWLLLFVGRALLWFASGLFLNLVAIVVVDIAPSNIRGRLGAIGATFVSLGNFLGFLLAFDSALGNLRLWEYGFLIFLVAQCAMLPFLAWMKETSWYLLIKGRNERAALDSVIFYTGNEAARVQTLTEELEDLEVIESLPPEYLTDEFSSFRSLFMDTGLRRAVASGIGICLSNVGPQVQAIYIAQLCSDMSVAENIAERVGVLFLGISLVGCFSSCFTIESMGRKNLLWIGTLSSTICWAITAMLKIMLPAQWETYPVLLFLMGAQFSGSFGVLPVHNILVAEIFPIKHRANGVAFCRIFDALFLSVEVCIFHNFLAMSSTLVCCILALVQLLSLVLQHFFLQVETRGRGQVEIFAEFALDMAFLRDLRKRELQRDARGARRSSVQRDSSASAKASVGSTSRTRQSSFASLADDFEKDFAKPSQIVENGPPQGKVKWKTGLHTATSMDDLPKLNRADTHFDAHNEIAAENEDSRVTAWLNNSR